MKKINSSLLKRLGAAWVGIFCLILGTAHTGAANGYYLTATQTNLTPGDNVQVTVHLSSGAEIDTVHTVISYPANLLQAVSVSPGQEPYELATLNDTSTAGQITIERFSVTGAPAGITGDNAIATITFKATSAGTAQIGFAGGTAAVRGGVVVPQPTSAINLAIAAPTPPPPPPTPPSNPTPPSSPVSGSLSSPNTGSNKPSSSRPATSSSSNQSSSASNTPQSSTDQSQITADSDGQPSNTANTKEHQITLTFVDQHGKPLKNARVTIGQNPSAVTNNQGQVTISGLPAGKYAVAVNYKGHNYPGQVVISDFAGIKLPSKKLVVTTAASGLFQPSLLLAILLVCLSGGYIILSSQFLYRKLFYEHVPITEASENLPGVVASANSYKVSDSLRVPNAPIGSMILPNGEDENEVSKPLYSLPRRIYGVSKPALAAVAITAGVLGSLTFGFGFAANSPKTYYVSPTGIDTNNGSQAAPVQTIQKGLSLASSGDTVVVNSGVYHEAVTLGLGNNGVTLKGAGATKPVVDGDNTRASGISLVNGVNGVTIDNFEVRNVYAPAGGRAAGIVSYNTYNDTISNNDVHDVHSAGAFAYGLVLGWNGEAGRVHDINVKNNRIHSIGPGGESMGIWTFYAKNMSFDGNEIYLVRKEGIRDWRGLNNSFTNNRLYLNWVGLTLESSVGGTVANNVSYDNAYGYDPKHVSESGSLSIWGLGQGQWSKFWHNTSYNNSHADIATAMTPAPAADFIDVRDNLFASPGDVHIHDFPSNRGPHIMVDGNAYSGNVPTYYTTFNSPHPDTFSSLTDLRTNRAGWETHGQNFNPQFKNPSIGDFNFNPLGLETGVNLGDAYGAQVGARLSTTATNNWVSYPANVIASSPLNGSFLKPQYASDGTDGHYWWAKNPNNNSVTFDLGSVKKINTFVLDVYSHLDSRTPKTLSIQLSGDNVRYSDALSITNPDSEGSSYKYSLPSTQTARYVKLNLIDNFGGSTTIFSDFKVGLLTPVIPAPGNQPPTVSISNPTANATYTEPAIIPIIATASDPDGQVTKVEYFAGTTKLGESLTPPYQFNWTKVAQGDYAITVHATDDNGTTTISAPINIKVTSVQTPPPTNCTISGDVNCDNKVDFLDLSSVLAKVNSTDLKNDVNHDGKIDFLDISFVISHFSR